jgi:hypothetical protein
MFHVRQLPDGIFRSGSWGLPGSMREEVFFFLCRRSGAFTWARESIDRDAIAA